MFGASILGHREAYYAQQHLKQILTEYPIKLEDGKWVAPAEGIEIPNLDSLPLCFWQDGHYILGNREGIMSIGLPGGKTTALVSNDPFLVVYVTVSKSELRNKEVACSESLGGFNPARQVKNGKMGRMPAIAKNHPHYIRLESGRWRWANLKELCDIVGMDAKTLLETYLQAADERLIEARDKTEYVELPEGMREEDTDFSMVGKIRPFTRVRWKDPRMDWSDDRIVDTNLYYYYKYRRVGFRSVIPCMERKFEHRDNPAHIFIPAGLAINILLLNQFGYQPRKFQG